MLARGKRGGACPSRWRRKPRPAITAPGILRRSCVSLVTPLPRSRRLRAQHNLKAFLGPSQQNIESPGLFAQREAMGNHGPHVDLAGADQIVGPPYVAVSPDIGSDVANSRPPADAAPHCTHPAFRLLCPPAPRRLAAALPPAARRGREHDAIR